MNRRFDFEDFTCEVTGPLHLDSPEESGRTIRVGGMANLSDFGTSCHKHSAPHHGRFAGEAPRPRSS